MSSADIDRLRDFGYRQQFDSALAISSAAIATSPSDPAGYYWQAAVLQLLINDSGRGALADSLYALSDRAVALCQQRLAKDPDDTQARLYLGLTQLNRASFLAWQQKAVAAFRICLSVGPHLSAALARDSSLADARLGLGTIEYFRAMSSRYTLGLRLTGSRKKAYALIRPLAVGRGPLNAAAQFVMVYMLKEDGGCDSAVAYCRRLLATYPGNRNALRMMRDAYYKAGRDSEAVRVGARIDSALTMVYRDNKYGTAENWMMCGKAYARMGQKREARERFDRVIAWEPYKNSVPWLSKFVREAKQWRKKL